MRRENTHSDRTGPLLAPEIDNVDRKILSILQREARLTNVDLSQRVGITSPPCLRRVRRLEDNGFIRGYRADLDPELLGFHVIAFVQVALGSQTHQELAAFAKRLREWGIVREAHALQGSADYLLKCVARDTVELNAFITDVLLVSPNVRNARTSVSYGQIKSDPGMPIEA